MTKQDANPYEAPQSDITHRSPAIGWTAIPAVSMAVFGAIHISFAAFAFFAWLLDGAVGIGVAGMGIGLGGFVLSIRAGRAWLLRDWLNANVLSSMVFICHVAEWVLVA